MNFVAELQQIKQQIVKAKINDRKSLRQLQSETGFWRLKKWRVLRDFGTRVSALEMSLENFFDDVVAVVNCRRADKVLAKSYAESLEQKNELRVLVSDDRPIGDVINDLLRVAQECKAELSELAK